MTANSGVNMKVRMIKASIEEAFRSGANSVYLKSKDLSVTVCPDYVWVRYEDTDVSINANYEWMEVDDDDARLWFHSYTGSYACIGVGAITTIKTR